MKRQRLTGSGLSCAWWLVILLAGAWCSDGLLGGEAGSAEVEPKASAVSTNSTAVEAEPLTFDVPQAVFVFDPNDEQAVDPFFPQSSRRRAKPKKEPEVRLNVDQLADRYVWLRGLTGPAGDQIALLNNQTFKVGDTVKVRLETQEGEPQQGSDRLEVTLVRVEGQSVVFRVAGGEREHTKQVREILGLKPAE